MRVTTISAAIALCAFACNSTQPKDAVEPYPLQTCLVSDNTLGSMGDPVGLIFEGRQLMFCCAPCVVEFEENPSGHLAKIEGR